MKHKIFLRYMLLTLFISMFGIGRAAAAEAYAVFTEKWQQLIFYYDNNRSSHSEGVTYSLNQGSSNPGWVNDGNNAKVGLVGFDASFANARPTSTYSWFKGMWLVEIQGLEYLNTSEVTNMCAMFAECQLDVSPANDIFELTFNTSKVTNMALMFSQCTKVKNIRLDFDTRNVTDMRSMFSTCSDLVGLDLSSFNTSKVEKMDWMFQYSSNLKTIYVGSGWDINHTPLSGTNMFAGCTSLVGGSGTTFSSNDLSMAHVDGGSSDPGYLTLNNMYVVYTKGPEFANLRFYCDDKSQERSGKIYHLKPLGGNPGWYEDGNYKYIIEAFFDASFANAHPTSTAYWFANTAIEKVDLQYLKTDKVTDMSYMFSHCSKLLDIDLSNQVTTNVTSMLGLFEECTSLGNLNLFNLDTRNVTDMQNMFLGCTSLAKIYVGDKWNTGKVSYSEDMFKRCNALSGEQGTPFNGSYADVLYARVDGGSSKPGYLTYGEAYANLAGDKLTFYVDAKRSSRGGNSFVINAYDCEWFDDPYRYTVQSSLTKVVFDPSFAKARPSSCAYWFSTMGQLQDFEGMEYFNTSRVTKMSAMFNSCRNLETLDLSHFDTSNVTDMEAMFADCESLKTIYVGEGWDVSKVTKSEDLFYGCYNLVGGQGTAFDEQHFDKAYAHIDGGTSNPGYLTDGTKSPYAVFNNDTMTFYYDFNKASREGTVYDISVTTGTRGWVADQNCYEVNTVVFDPSFADYRPTSCYAWFNKMENLTEIVGMKDYLNTDSVTSMQQMFDGCRSIEVLDLSNFNTTRVKNMYSMFANCTSLTTIIVGEDWSTMNLATAENTMFSNCRKLVGMAGTTYDKNNTGKSYAHPDGGAANPGYLTTKTMYALVDGSTLRMLYDADFYNRTEPVYKVDEMGRQSRENNVFKDIVTVEFDPSFADARPISTSNWFVDMPKVSTFKGMKEYLNTSRVISMRSMFYYLLYVEELDLSGFDTHNVQDMSVMFGAMSYLEKIYVGDGWDTSSVTNSTDMFNGCRRLVGGAGTVYDENYTDASYAHIDGGAANPGYFTEAPKYKKGDVNGDGAVDVADIASIIDVMAGSGLQYKERADVNDDKSVDVADIATVIDLMAASARQER